MTATSLTVFAYMVNPVTEESIRLERLHYDGTSQK